MLLIIREYPLYIRAIRVALHLLLHLFRKQPRLATFFAGFQFPFFIGFGFQAFRSRAAAFFATGRRSEGNSEEEEEEQREIAGKLHVVNCELSVVSVKNVGSGDFF